MNAIAVSEGKFWQRMKRRRIAARLAEIRARERWMWPDCPEWSLPNWKKAP